MPRYALPTTLADLKQKFMAKFTPFEKDGDIYAFIELFRKDLKIQFDFENMAFNDIEAELEYRVTPQGLPYILAWAAGDWEEVVYFILYLDNKNTLRLYIPTDGNTFDIRIKMAYGNDLYDDSLLNKLYTLAEIDHMKNGTLSEFDGRNELSIPAFEADIDNRIKIV